MLQGGQRSVLLSMNQIHHTRLQYSCAVPTEHQLAARSITPTGYPLTQESIRISAREGRRAKWIDSGRGRQFVPPRNHFLSSVEFPPFPSPVGAPAEVRRRRSLLFWVSPQTTHCGVTKEIQTECSFPPRAHVHIGTTPEFSPLAAALNDEFCSFLYSPGHFKSLKKQFARFAIFSQSPLAFLLALL